MPEIVEVCWLSNYLNTFKNYSVKSVKSLSPKYKTQDLAILTNLKISCVNTHGKLLWFEFINSDIILICHFGLHGLFTHKKGNTSKVEIELELNDIVEYLYFNAQLNGSINVVTKLMLQTKLNELADDFFKTKIDETVLLNRLNVLTKNGTTKLTKKIVGVLLEQNKKDSLGSGIGNYLVAEILYEAKISPHTTLKMLLDEPTLVTQLSLSIIKILKHAYMTSTENYFKKIDKRILDYVIITRTAIPLEYNYYPEIEVAGVFNCKVYKKTEVNGKPVISEKIVGSRECYWVPGVDA